MKTILITGASSGIGRALAVQAARAGYAVYAVGRNVRALAALAGQIAEEGGTMCTDVTDIGDPDNAPGLIGRAVGAFGHVDVLVNNAGFAAHGPLATQNDEQLRAQFGTHVLGPIALTREALPTLRASRGHVFMIGSGVARVPIGGMGAYPPSKAALRSATAILRRELVPLDVAVTYVDPGAVDTGFMTRAGMPGAPRDVLISPEAVARKILLAISTRPRVLNIAPLQSAAVAIAEAFPAIAEAVIERNPNLVGAGPSLAAIEVARESASRGEKIALPSSRSLPFAPVDPPAAAAAAQPSLDEAQPSLSEAQPASDDIQPAPEPAAEAASPHALVDAAVEEAIVDEAVLPTLDGTIDAPVIGPAFAPSEPETQPAADARLESSAPQPDAEAQADVVPQPDVVAQPDAEARADSEPQPGFEVPSDFEPQAEFVAAHGRVPEPAAVAAHDETPDPATVSAGSTLDESVPYVQPAARWQFEPPEADSDSEFSETRASAGEPGANESGPLPATDARSAELPPPAADVVAALALPTEDDDTFVPDESSERHNLEPSATGKSFDAALEPLLRRMERANLTIDFVRSVMIPDAVVDVGETAMRWAGMPNKHERALTSEVFFALAEWGFLAPRADGRYRVLYPADGEPHV